MRLLLVFGLCLLVNSQSEDDSALHFSHNANGRAVWIVDETSLPWVGSFEYLSSQQGHSTVLMTVVDSSTGLVMGECTTPSHGSKWVRFQWVLASDSMQCTVSPTNSSRVVFPQSHGPRSFSVRIQSRFGPACMRDMIVQNEKPIGCPPHLSRNRFSSLHLNCSCPFESTSAEDRSIDSSEPQFPLFELSPTAPPVSQETPSFTLGPCATHHCQNNGTCVVTTEGQATCLCPNGFYGSQCEVDVCSTVPCQNGGVCRANGGNEAVCECAAGFTGILCESSACNPECSNGDCIIEDGNARCECRQGFIGINCNVVDVCLGDAACSMFGDHAKCVPEASNFNLNSPSLVNSTYDCRCPHPVSGEFVDCLELHLASVAPSSMSTAPPPVFPAIGGVPGLLPSTAHTVVEETTQLSSEMEEESEEEAAPNPVFSVHPSSFAPNLPIVISSPNTQQPPFQPEQTTTTNTFIFPQVSQNIGGHQPTHAVVPTVRPSTFETSPPTTQGFPTPSPMDVLPVASSALPPFHVLPTTTTTTAPEVTETSAEEPSSTETGTEETVSPDYEEEEEETTEMPTTQPTETETPSAPTTVWLPPSTEPSTTFETTMSTLPFWMFTTTVPPTPFVPVQTVPQRPETPRPPPPTTTTSPVESEEEEEDEQVVDSHESGHEAGPVSTTTTTVEDVDLQETGGRDRQKSSAASWIVAILALIVLGLLLLAAAIFVLRYIKQSRKLHGKYNPAREEHALSAAYSMPMSHITKEERLI